MILDWRFSKRLTYFIGQNGLGKCSGIGMSDLGDSDEQVLVIQPITSRNMIANCSIVVPLEDIGMFIEKLKQYERQKSKS